jgi:hypothetical protein
LIAITVFSFLVRKRNFWDTSFSITTKIRI